MYSLNARLYIQVAQTLARGTLMYIRVARLYLGEAREPVRETRKTSRGAGTLTWHLLGCSATHLALARAALARLLGSTCSELIEPPKHRLRGAP